MISWKHIPPTLALALVLTATVTCHVSAQTNIDWGQTTGDWSDTSGWVGGNIPDSATETATLGGTDEYAVDFDFNNLSIGGLAITNSNAVLNISGSNFGDRQLNIGSSFTNSGEINLNSSSGGLGGIVNVVGTLTNQGSLSFGGARDTSTSRNRINADVVNAGTITVDRNGFINGDLTNDGTINVAEGSTLSFTSGNTINQNSGSLNFAAASTRLNDTTLNFNGGQITGEDITLEASTLNLAAGITREFNLEGANTVTIDGPSGLTFNLNATGFSDSTVNLDADFVNAGEINLNSSTTRLGGVVNLEGTFTNEGSLNFGGATDTDPNRNRINADVVNTGTITADRNGFINGDLTNDGTINVAEGSTFQTNGAFTNGSGGVLTGEGEFEFDGISALTLGGTISPGDQIGQLSFGNDLQFEDSAVLAIELGGTTQIDQYDLLSSDGAIDLAGLLSVSFVDDFQNLILGADDFTILTASDNLTGIFSGITDGGTLLTDDRRGSFTVNYTDTSVVLSNFTTVGVPEPSSAVLLATMLAICSLPRQKRPRSGTGRRESW